MSVSALDEASNLLPDGWTLSDVGHGALDVAGLVPVFGEAADLANAAWYAAEGEYLGAGLSIVAMVPLVGDAIGKGGKLLMKGGSKLAGPALQALKKIDFKETLKPLSKHPKIGPNADKIAAALEKWRQDLLGLPPLRPNGLMECPVATKALGEAAVMVGDTPVPRRIIDNLDGSELAIFQNTLKDIVDIPFIPRPNKAVFYSGKLNGKNSWQIAEDRAFVGEFDSVNTLSDNILNRDCIRSALPYDAMRFIDNTASRKLAKNARGDIIFLGDLDSISEGSVFRTIELPQLLNNKSISTRSHAELQKIKDFLDEKYGP